MNKFTQTTLTTLMAITFSSVTYSVHADSLTTQISTGVFYAIGQNDTPNASNNNLIVVPLNINWQKSKLSAGLSASYLNSEYNGTTNAGIGDTYLTLGYDLTSKPWLRLQAKYKFATGDQNKGLSTGKDDIFAQINYFQPLSTNTSLFATTGYKFTGKVAGQSMQDTFYASFGGGYLPTPGLNLGASIDYRQATYTTLDDTTSLSVFLNKKLTQKLNTSVFTSYDTAKTASIGLTLSYRL